MHTDAYTIGPILVLTQCAHTEILMQLHWPGFLLTFIILGEFLVADMACGLTIPRVLLATAPVSPSPVCTLCSSNSPPQPLCYLTVSSLSEVPCDAHTSSQTSFRGKAHPACPLFPCLLLQVSASSQLWHKLVEIFGHPSIRPWPPTLPVFMGE